MTQKPPSPSQPSLDEVERAISVLGGRHPDHERIRRETMEAAEQRRGILEAELARSAGRRRARLAATVGAVLAVGALLGIGGRTLSRAHRLRQLIGGDEAPFAPVGFVEIATNALTGAAGLEADTPAASCFLSLATSGGVRVRVGASTFQADRSVAWCACAPGHVRVEADPAGRDAVGLALERVDASVVGGSLARAWAPIHPGAWGPGDEGCADAILDSWIASGRGPRPVVDGEALRSIAGGDVLERAGLHVVASVEASLPFGVVTTDGGECLLAIGAREDALSLRLVGGARPIARADGVLAWCAASPATTTIWRAATGARPVMVLAGKATRLGGMLGTRECAHDAGYEVPLESIWLPEEDLAWDASAILAASTDTRGSGELVPAVPATPDARLSFLVRTAGARVAAEPASAAMVCDPSLHDDTAREIVCAHEAPVTWWRRGDAAAAQARTPLPFWLSTFEGHFEPDAVASEVELLALARRLIREGFEPTVLQGVTELSSGVRVTGRANEDEIVAVGLGPKAPWVFPYTNSVPWDLGDAPVVVKLQPGTSVMLTASPAPALGLDKRRTVVFRHAAED